MKKQIIPKTILFVFIFVFINIFIAIFGKENSLIGVIIITMLLMLLQRNLAISPIKNTFKLLAINLFLGIFAFLSVQNIYLGIVCNLIAMFVVGYLFSYNLKSHLDIAFGLLYLFMLGVPVTIEQLPLRLMSLVGGTLIIMLSQIITNKNKLEKSSDKLINQIASLIAEKSDLLKNGKNIEAIDLKLKSSLKQIKSILYDNRKDGFFLSDNGVNIFNIVFNFERIDELLNNYKYDKDVLLNINEELKKLKDYVSEVSEKNNRILNSEKSRNLHGFYDALENIYYYLDKYKNNSSEKDIYENIEIPHNFKKLYIYKDHLSVKSMKFTYAIKVAIGIAIAGFIMDYFNLSGGRWILYTVFSIIQPYTEDGIVKTKKRVFGTVFGCISVFILFSIFKNSTVRSLLIIFVGYLSGYAKEIDYKYEMICITISAVGVVSVLTSPETFIINRLMFIALGAIIALIINRLILPYNINTAYNVLVEMHGKTIKEMESEVSLALNGNGNRHKIKSLLLISNLIEDKLSSMNGIVKNENHDLILNKNRSLANNMYSTYLKTKNKKG